MKRNIKKRLSETRDDVTGAAEKVGNETEEKFNDMKHTLKRGRSKLKSKL